MTERKFVTEAGRELVKDPTVAWAIHRVDVGHNGELWPTPIPAETTLTGSPPGFDSGSPIVGEVVGIVPATPGTLRVGVFDAAGDLQWLGYEYPHASNPDWDEAIDTRGITPYSERSEE